MLRLSVEISVAVGVANLGGVLVVCDGAFEIARESTRIADSDLPAQILDDVFWHVRRVRKKGAEESNRRKLHGKAEAVVISPAL